MLSKDDIINVEHAEKMADFDNDDMGHYLVALIRSLNAECERLRCCANCNAILPNDECWEVGVNPCDKWEERDAD